MRAESVPRILVVDDEPDVRRLITEVLRRKNYLVEQAGGGKAALELFRQHPHDLVITDIRMPEMDGFELMQKIKEISPTTEIIVMTGHVSRESVVRALDLGAYTYFVKPFECLDVIPLLTLKTLEHRKLLRENERLIDMLRRYLTEKQKELVTFEEIAEGLSQLKNHMDLVRLLLNRVSRELQACGVWVWSLRENRLLPLCHIGLPADSVETNIPMGIGDGPIGTVAETGRQQYIEDLTKVADHPWVQHALDAGVRSLHAVPLMIETRAAGVLCACFYESEPLELRRMESIQGFSRKMALVLKMIRMYQELLTQNEQLEKAQTLLLQTEQLSAQGRLASGIAHELGGPLGVIETTSHYLLESEPDSDEIRECLEVIRERAEEMNSFIIDMLELTRDRAMAFQPVNLHTLITRILRFLKQQIRTQNVQVERDFCAGLPLVEVDIRKFNQVMINLFLNALDAMKADGAGVLSIRTTCHPKSGHPDSGYVDIDVEDTGPGVHEADRKRVFTPFFSKKVDGTGLGLAITQQIINDHGGLITVGNGAEGRGAKFTVHLPVVQDNEQAADRGDDA